MKTKFRKLLCSVMSLMMILSLLPMLPANAAVEESYVALYDFNGTPTDNEMYKEDTSGNVTSADTFFSAGLSTEKQKTLQYGATDGNEKVLKITGDEFLSTLYKPGTTYYGFDKNLLQQVDFKFSGFETDSMARFFGWSNGNSGSFEMYGASAGPDSGVMLRNGGLYVRTKYETDEAGNYINNYGWGTTYVDAMDIYSTPVTSGTLAENTWYTITRIVDFSETLNEMQKVIVKERSTGQIVAETDWIPAGKTNASDRGLSYTAPIRTRNFTNNATIMIDNYKLAVLPVPEINYELVLDDSERGVAFTPSEPLVQTTYDFSDTTIFNDNKTWRWNGGDGKNPYIMEYSNYGKIGLTNDEGSHVYTPETFNVGVSDGSFKVNGDTFVYHLWTRDFSGFEQTKVDVKFNFASRESSEGSALVKLFGYNAFSWQASNEQANSYGNIPDFGDSGLVFINGGLYTIADIGNGKTAAMKSLTADDNNYTQLLSSVYTNNVLAPGTLTDDTWYTVERIVDMTNARSTASNLFVTHNQKIKITEKATGNVILVTGWIPAGYNNSSSRELQTSLLAYSKGFKTGDVIEFDNYSQTKGSVTEVVVDDYLNDGQSDTNKPRDIRFNAIDKIKTPTMENVKLYKGESVINPEEGYYSVTPDADGDSFVVSFDNLVPETEYTLVITCVEDVATSVRYMDRRYTFTTGEETAFVPLEITNKSFVTEADDVVTSFTAGQRVRAAVEIENDGGDTSNMLIIMAVYDGDRMTAALVCEQTEFPTGTYYTPYYTPESDTETAKILIWDNWNSMKPVEPAFTLGGTFSR